MASKTHFVSDFAELDGDVLFGAGVMGGTGNRSDVDRDRVSEELINVLHRAQTMTPNFVFHRYKVSFSLLKP